MLIANRTHLRLVCHDTAAQIENMFLAVLVRRVHLCILPIVSNVVGEEVLESLDNVPCQSLVDLHPQNITKGWTSPNYEGLEERRRISQVSTARLSRTNSHTVTLIGKPISRDACCVTSLPVTT